MNDGGSAFPVIDGGGIASYTDQDGYHYLKIETRDGMSLRDWFAGQVVAAVIAFEDRALDTHDALPIETVARQSYELADAMLKARERNE